MGNYTYLEESEFNSYINSKILGKPLRRMCSDILSGFIWGVD